MKSLFLIAALMLSILPTAHASGLPIAHEDLASQAELIVMGSLSERKELDAQWATAKLTITETLKGDATLKTVTLRFLAKPGNTATWTYEGTEKGIWFVSKVSADPVLYATFHSNGLVRTTFTDPESIKQVNEFIEKTRKLIAAPRKDPPPNPK